MDNRLATGTRVQQPNPPRLEEVTLMIRLVPVLFRNSVARYAAFR